MGEQVKALQREFGGIVKVVKSLKQTVVAPVKELEPRKIDEVNEILNAQQNFSCKW